MSNVKAFFDNSKDADKVSKNLDVEKDCEISILADSEELRVAINQESIAKNSYSIAVVSEPD